MASVSLKDIRFSYPILDSVRLLKTQILRSAAVGGRLKRESAHKVSVEVLNGLSLEIKNGERVGLLGHNGCGKSTLLRLIAGIYLPDAGELNVTGHTVPLFDMASGMNLDATGEENIYLRGYMLGMDKREIDEKKSEIIEFSELRDFIHLPVSTYSQGMFTRLAFSISTAVEADIILIDEGIGAGDANFQQKAAERIQSLMKNTKILLFASHSTLLLNLYCNKIVHIEEGKIQQISNNDSFIYGP
jgi:lipopolysaccharide transport system ATP-binding protein